MYSKASKTRTLAEEIIDFFCRYLMGHLCSDAFLSG